MKRRDPDARLAARAIREGWDVPAEKRGELIARLVAIAADPSSRPREAVMAAKALLTAGRLNLETIRVTMAAEEHEDLRARLERLERAVADGAGGEPPSGEVPGPACR